MNASEAEEALKPPCPDIAKLTESNRILEWRLNEHIADKHRILREYEQSNQQFRIEQYPECLVVSR
jgi:hypothetical protein